MHAASRPRLAGSLVYFFFALVNGIFGFVLPFALTLVGLVLSAIWVGLPVLMLVTMYWRGLARMERRWLRTTIGVAIPNPYRPPPASRVFGRWRAKLRDPATWRDIGYLALRLPLGAIEFALTIAFWGYGAFLLLMPAYVPFLPANWEFNVPDFGGGMVRAHEARAMLWCAIGAVLLLLAVLITRLLARFHALLASALLGPTRSSQLAARAEELQASRARGVDAAEAERRRIERDLHDGAQQRLIAVAMAVGRAKAKLEHDPDAVRALLDEAHSDAKLAVAELRDLARGIYPAVLGDRGLDAALSALATRCPVPVDVEVDPTLSAQARPPAAVESTAYFIVAETLTNVAKHAEAGQVRVRVRHADNAITVEVSDDGRGGAELRAGGGLAGLADRAATIDGVMTVSSPPGGPTVVGARLPCAW